jgi:hypothetical protein
VIVNVVRSRLSGATVPPLTLTKSVRLILHACGLFVNLFSNRRERHDKTIGGFWVKHTISSQSKNHGSVYRTAREHSLKLGKVWLDVLQSGVSFDV